MNNRTVAFHTGLPEGRLKLRRAVTGFQIPSWQVLSSHVTNTYLPHSLIVLHTVLAVLGSGPQPSR